MRCAFDPEGPRLAVARLTGVYLFRVRRQEVADENPLCPADRLGVTRGERTHGCGDGTELADSGLKVLDIPAAINPGRPVSAHAHSIPFCVPQQKNVEASYATHSVGSGAGCA
jgi:hypothetical protein